MRSSSERGPASAAMSAWCAWRRRDQWRRLDERPGSTTGASRRTGNVGGATCTSGGIGSEVLAGGSGRTGAQARLLDRLASGAGAGDAVRRRAALRGHRSWPAAPARARRASRSPAARRRHTGRRHRRRSGRGRSSRQPRDRLGRIGRERAHRARRSTLPGPERPGSASTASAGRRVFGNHAALASSVRHSRHAPTAHAAVISRVGVERDQPFAARVVGHRGDRAGVVGVDERLDLLLDFLMRHHLAADLAEARQPVGDGDEAVLVHPGDVARDTCPGRRACESARQRTGSPR